MRNNLNKNYVTKSQFINELKIIKYYLRKFVVELKTLTLETKTWNPSKSGLSALLRLASCVQLLSVAAIISRRRRAAAPPHRRRAVVYSTLALFCTVY